MRADETNKHYKVGYVSGSFDMFHIGHLNLIRRAKERCEYLIAGVLPDDVIFTRKNKWPIIPLKERMEIVGAIRYIDRVEPVPIELTPRVAAQKYFKYDAFFTGDDYQTEGAKKTERELNALGADLVFFPYTKEISSSMIREKIMPSAGGSVKTPAKTQGFKYIFPFDRVKKGEKIVIFGTGNVAGQYLRQLQALDYCEIAAFTDSECESESEFSGYPLIPAERLCGGWYDRIVIASVRYYDQIEEILRAIGVQDSRIV